MGGSTLFNEPISDSWTIIRICIAFYLLIITACSVIDAFLNTQYNKHWINLYSQWILTLNTFNSVLSTFVTASIWYRFKYPTTQKNGSKYSITFNNDNFTDSDNEEELGISLHSDKNDDEDTIDTTNAPTTERLHATNNGLKFPSHGLIHAHNLSLSIQHVGLSAHCMLVASYCIERSSVNSSDTDWIVSILNVNNFIFIPCLLLFSFYGSFNELNYSFGAVYICLFDVTFSLFIALFDILNHGEVKIDFPFLCLLIFFHICIHFTLTFTKNIWLFRYIKSLKLQKSKNQNETNDIL